MIPEREMDAVEESVRDAAPELNPIRGTFFSQQRDRASCVTAGEAPAKHQGVSDRR